MILRSMLVCCIAKGNNLWRNLDARQIGRLRGGAFFLCFCGSVGGRCHKSTNLKQQIGAVVKKGNKRYVFVLDPVGHGKMFCACPSAFLKNGIFYTSPHVFAPG